MQGVCPCALRLMTTGRSKGIGRTLLHCGSGSPTGGLIGMRVFWGKEHKRFSVVVTPRRDAVGRYVTRGVVPTALFLQLFEQRLGLLEIGGVKALGKPPVDGCQELVGLNALALLLPQATEAHGGPQLQGLGVLVAGHVEGVLKTGCRLLLLRRRDRQE